MSSFIRQPFLSLLLAMLGVACGKSDSSLAESARQAQHTSSFPESLAYFEAAEQRLAERRYTLAAKQLDKGIVAFRIETGKMSGLRAARANRAIDNLTRLRKTLRQGQAIDADELHQAILTAMESEPGIPVIAHPKPGAGLGVPVGGH